MEEPRKERRLKPRFSAELPCSLALGPGEGDMLFLNENLDARTRDLSETGVGLVAGSIYLGYTCVVDAGRSLLLTLELPAGTVRVEATSAHYLRLDAGDAAPSYLIGLRITSMSEEARSLYNSFLEELSRNSPPLPERSADWI